MVQSNGNYNNIIIQGDFNFKNLIWNNGIIDFEIGMCGQAELLASLMRNRFLINHINIPTRKENTLDLILSNIPEWFADSRYEINQNFLDHNFVICE